MFLFEYLNPEQFEEVLALFRDSSKHHIAIKYLKGFLVGSYTFLESGDVVYVSIYNSMPFPDYLTFRMEYISENQNFSCCTAYYQKWDIPTIDLPEFAEYYNNDEQDWLKFSTTINNT